MSRIGKVWLLGALLFCVGIAAKGQVEQARNSSEANFEQSAGSGQEGLNFRIENGKCWINGNLVAAKDLPKGLQNLDKAIFYQAAVFGIPEISFVLGGKEYLVRKNRIVELEPVQRGALNVAANSLGNSSEQRVAEEYYSQLKRESPGLFYGMSYEGALYEQCRTLLLDYQMAKGSQKEKIREELRLVLGQLFEINERNRELELEQLERMLETARKEVSYRKANKSVIIQNTLDQLLDD